MTKKSALTMAAALTIALLVGVAAMTLTFGGTSVANASRDRKPIVKHQVQTVTVHRKRDASSSGDVRVVHLSSTDPTVSSGSDDAFDRDHVPAFGLDAEHEAGADRLAVDEAAGQVERVEGHLRPDVAGTDAGERGCHVVDEPLDGQAQPGRHRGSRHIGQSVGPPPLMVTSVVTSKPCRR